MATFDLVPFAPCAAAVLGEVLRQGRLLSATYRIRGEAPPLPPREPAPRRAHELWRATCFELFLWQDDQPGYLEVNLAPSGAWNVYAFDDYRAGMREAPLPEGTFAAPFMEGAFRFSLALPAPFAAAPTLRAAPTAVLLHADGQHSYHALYHPAARPDFHLRLEDALRL